MPIFVISIKLIKIFNTHPMHIENTECLIFPFDSSAVFCSVRRGRNIIEGEIAISDTNPLFKSAEIIKNPSGADQHLLKPPRPFDRSKTAFHFHLPQKEKCHPKTLAIPWTL